MGSRAEPAGPRLSGRRRRGLRGLGPDARFYSQTLFYERAANGTLPSLSWILPPQQACDHPCHDIAKGERLLKDVYEALRAGPKWKRTLLFVAYDDAGGYYDHVVPPSEGVPADESPCVVPGAHPLYVGSTDGSSHKFWGYIDELAVWNRGLSAEEVKAAMLSSAKFGAHRTCAGASEGEGSAPCEREKEPASISLGMLPAATGREK